jgi:predicted HTH domain antitoxin
MRSVKLAEFNRKPSDTLRKARKTPVVVTRGDRPEAIIFHLDANNILSEPTIRLAVVTALYVDGDLSLGQAAEELNMSPGEFMKHLGQLRIPTITGSAQDAVRDLQVLRKWTASS